MKSLMEEMGPAYWAQLHGTLPPGATDPSQLVGGFCDTLVCPHCQQGCKMLMSAVHDLKNAQHGKPMMFPENFKKVAHMFQNPHTTCAGTCPNQVKSCAGGRCRAH